MLKKHYVIGATGLAVAAAGAIVGLGALQAGAQTAAEPPPPPPAFETIDSNKDGAISKAEFQAFAAHMPPHGPHDGHMHHRLMPMDVGALDKNGDGKVSFDEFAAPMKAHFAELDANHDGFLQTSELPQLPRDGGGMPPAPLSGN